MLDSVLLKLIKLYQKTLSPDQGLFGVFRIQKTCRFYPSCSQYLYLAVKKHGSQKGLRLGLRRILKCHPWHPGGVDLP
jgi:hypothetical protein